MELLGFVQKEIQRLREVTDDCAAVASEAFEAEEGERPLRAELARIQADEAKGFADRLEAGVAACATADEARNARLLDRLKASDAVILVEDGGLSGFAWAKGPGELPMSCKVSYGEDDDPPRTIRRIEVTAGWTLADWRKLDRSALTQQERTH